MSNIEDFIESISYVPVDIRRNLGLLAELDNKEIKIREQLQINQKILIQIIKLPSTKENDAYKNEIRDNVERLHLESLGLRREKIQVTEQSLRIITQYNKDLNKFEEEFRNVSLPDSIQNNNMIVVDEINLNTRNAGVKRNNREYQTNYQSIQQSQHYDNFQYPISKNKDKQKKQKNTAVIQAQITPIQDFIIMDEQPQVEQRQYCVCDGTGQDDTMIACDDDNCEIQWYHLKCIGLIQAPLESEKWYCDRCQKNN